MSTEVLVDTEEQTRTARPWQVILHNDDWHPFDLVVLYIQKATGCNEPTAYRITLTAHDSGQAQPPSKYLRVDRA